jgi:hypothetical protein
MEAQAGTGSNSGVPAFVFIDKEEVFGYLCMLCGRSLRPVRFKILIYRL